MQAHTAMLSMLMFAPEVFFEDAWKHEHLHIHSFEHVAAAGHAGTEGPGRQLRHGQVSVVALVVPHNDGAGLPSPAVNDVAGTGVRLEARPLQGRTATSHFCCSSLPTVLTRLILVQHAEHAMQ